MPTSVEPYVRSDQIRCREQWIWTGQLAIVCRAFRGLSRQVAPDSLICFGARTAAFLISFCENAWKKERIVKFEFSCGVDNTSVRDAFLWLLEAPDSFPNLTKFDGTFSGRTGWRPITAPRFLYNLARSCPNLFELSLFMPGGLRGPVHEFLQPNATDLFKCSSALSRLYPFAMYGGPQTPIFVPSFNTTARVSPKCI